MYPPGYLCPIVRVAEQDGEIVGVLRGRQGRLHSLFVAARYHGQGSGRQLLERLEEICLQGGAKDMTLSSSL